ADAYLLGRLGRAPGVAVELLDGLSFRSAAGLMLHLGWALERGASLPRSWNPGPLRSRYASIGLEWLERGWPGFDQALTRILEHSLSWKSRRVIGTYSRLTTWLNRAPADLEPFRARVVAHAAAHKVFGLDD